MARTLSLVCIIAMMSSTRTEDFYQRATQTVHPTRNAYKNPQNRNLYTSSPLLEYISTRYPENRVRTNKVDNQEKLQEAPRVDNGTYKIFNRLQVNKRGALEYSVGESLDRVVFPGPTSATSPIDPGMPDECKEQGYCEEVPNYPVNLVERAIERLGDRVNYLQNDTLPREEDKISIVQRLGGGGDVDIPVCNSIVKVIYPKAAVGSDGKWYTVLNREVHPIQGVLTEICDTSVSKKCSNLISISGDYTDTCVQKHVYRPLQVLNHSNGMAVRVPVKMPSCCSCVLNKI